MFVSAEVRWFWPSAEPPLRFREWFLSSVAHPCAAGGGLPRDDAYLDDPGQTELGIKARGSKPGLEVKGLVALLPDAIPDGPFKGPVEIWTKWTSSALKLRPEQTKATTKTRWLRKFDTTDGRLAEIEVGSDEEPLVGSRPAAGCNVELARVNIGAETVWTFGLEAFGALGSLTAQIQAVASVLVSRTPPPMGDVVVSSYPGWLNARAKAFIPKMRAV